MDLNKVGGPYEIFNKEMGFLGRLKISCCLYCMYVHGFVILRSTT